MNNTAQLPETGSQYFDCQYLVCFHVASEQGLDTGTIGRKVVDATRPHGLMHAMLPALPALWYCCHLPRTLGDLMHPQLEFLADLRSLETPQHISLVPSSLLPSIPDSASPVLIIGDDRDEQEIALVAARLKPPLGFSLFSQLSQESLEGHWKALLGLAGARGTLMRVPRLSPNVLLEPDHLSYVMAHRQLADIDDSERSLLEADPEERLRMNFETNAVMKALAQTARSNEADEGAQDQILEACRRNVLVHVSLAIPGAPRQHVRQTYADNHWKRFPDPTSDTSILPWNRSFDWQHDAESAEESVIRLLLSHRAMARGGIGFRTKSASNEEFRLLADIEKAGTSRQENPRKMWQLLRQFSDRCLALLDSRANFALRRASHLCIFSNLPVGLTIPPGQSDPLALCLPTSYRPLVSLTNCLRTELRSAYVYYPTRICRVLMAECLKPDDPIRKISDAGWKVIQKQALTAEIQMHRVEIASVRALVQTIESQEFDVLILSAHGFYEENVAGVWVHDERCIDLPVGRMPPVVILSACHSAPRGRVALSIADMLIQRGALAVLGTQIPIDVRRNALLMSRLFTYWSEAGKPGGVGHGNLAQMWRHVIASHAAIDIAHVSERVSEWFYLSGAIKEFMHKRSVGALTTGHVHQQSKEILLQMAQEDNPSVARAFGQALRERMYFPETFFYYWLGWPEHVVFQPRFPVVEGDLMRRIPRIT